MNQVEVTLHPKPIPKKEFNQRVKSSISNLINAVEGAGEYEIMDPFSMAVATNMMQDVLTWKSFCSDSS